MKKPNIDLEGKILDASHLLVHAVAPPVFIPTSRLTAEYSTTKTTVLQLITSF